MTELISSTITNCDECLKEFGASRSDEKIPIVCVPTSASFPFVSIPHGVYAIKTSNGVIDNELMKPGFNFMLPWEKVGYLVTKQFNHFDIPIKGCPTRDNVMVKIDVFLMFRIVDALTFIRRLSPPKLADLLKAAQEEAVRNLAQATKHSQIYDLIKFNEEEVVRDLSKRVAEFGVEVSDVMITEVILPDDIAQRLERETTYISKNREQKKRQEYEMQKTRNVEIIEKKKLEYKNLRLAAEEEAKKQRAIVGKGIDEVQARTRKMLAEINEEQKRLEYNIRETAKKIEAEFMANRRVALEEIKAQANARREELFVELRNYDAQLMSKAELRSAEYNSKATKLIAEAESKASEQLKKKREFIVELNRLRVLEGLQSNSNVLVQGKTGGNLVAQMEASKIAKSLFPQ